MNGDTTTLTKARPDTDSLRTTVPKGIVNQFGLKEGDKLVWQIIAEDKELGIKVIVEK